MRAFRALVRGTLLSLMFITPACIATAKGWDVDVRFNGETTSILRNLDPTKAGYSCPEHFRPVQLAVEIDEFKKLTIKAIGSEFFQSNIVNRAIAEENLTLSFEISILGCAYKQHLLVRKGYVVANGDLGIGRIENVRFLHADDQEDDTLRTYYEAQLSAPPAASDAEPAGSLENMQPIGSLSLVFDFESTYLAAAKREGDWVHLGQIGLSINVLPDDS